MQWWQQLHPPQKKHPRFKLHHLNLLRTNQEQFVKLVELRHGLCHLVNQVLFSDWLMSNFKHSCLWLVRVWSASVEGWVCGHLLAIRWSASPPCQHPVQVSFWGMWHPSSFYWKNVKVTVCKNFLLSKMAVLMVFRLNGIGIQWLNYLGIYTLDLIRVGVRSFCTAAF